MAREEMYKWEKDDTDEKTMVKRRGWGEEIKVDGVKTMVEGQTMVDRRERAKKGDGEEKITVKRKQSTRSYESDMNINLYKNESKM